MALDRSLVGRSYAPSAVYEVGRVKIAEFARAIGEDSAIHRDPEAALAAGYPDVIAPPTFAIAVSLEAAMVVLDDPDVAIDYSRVVHGEQRFEHTRPIRAGDALTVTVTLETVRSAGGHDMLISRSDVVTVEGEHVAAVRSTLVVRGEG